MKILSVLVLAVGSTGFLNQRSQASSLLDAGRSSSLTSTTTSFHNKWQTLSGIHGQSLEWRALSRQSTSVSPDVSRLNRRGACVGKHPCQENKSPPSTPRRTHAQSSDTSHSPASHAPGSVSSFRTPPQNRLRTPDSLNGPALSRLGSISSFGTPPPHLTPLNRSPIRQPEFEIRPQLGYGASVGNPLYTSSSSDFPSPPSGIPPRINTPVRLEHIRSRPQIRPGGSTRNSVQVSRDAAPSLNRVKHAERASSSSTQHTDVTIGEMIPDRQAKAHGALSRFYSNLSRGSSLDDPEGLAKRARWDQLHKVHRASSEHYHQMSNIMKSGADLLPMEN